MVGWEDGLQSMSLKLEESKQLLDDIQRERQRKETEVEHLGKSIRSGQAEKIRLTLENARLEESMVRSGMMKSGRGDRRVSSRRTEDEEIAML